MSHNNAMRKKPLTDVLVHSSRALINHQATHLTRQHGTSRQLSQYSELCTRSIGSSLILAVAYDLQTACWALPADVGFAR